MLRQLSGILIPGNHLCRRRPQGTSIGRQKKRREGRRNRLKGARGRGTLEKDKPPIFGMMQRGGQVVIHMLENVRQVTIHPLIQTTIASGTLVLTDDYDIYCRLPAWGYDHKALIHFTKSVTD